VNAVAIVTIAALVRLVFAALIPVFPDETYYWEWSRHLAPGYFDHPAGIAVLIRLGGLVLQPFHAGATPVGVRLGVIAAGWIAALATVGIARRLRGDAAATCAAVAITVMPLAAAGLILATPDVPVLMMTAICLYWVTRALEHPPRSVESLRWWSLTGIALGLAFSSKYTSIFLPIGVVVAVLARPSLRVRLAEPGPYISCLLATLVFLPVLLWNREHDWISFLFQVKHGLAAPQGSALAAAWKHEGDFWGGQAALASPILFVMMGMAVLRVILSERSDRTTCCSPHDIMFVLAVVALVSFGFFVYSAIRQRVEPNWPAPAYVPAIVLLATVDWSSTAGKWLRGGIVFAAAMSALIYLQGVVPILPIAPRKDPIARAFGWRELAVTADSTASAIHRETSASTWLGGDRYQEASELAFHDPAHPTTFATNLSGRVNQYDLWPGFPHVARRGDNLVLALDESDGPHDAVKVLMPYFREVRRGALVSLRRGRSEIAARRLWVLVAWRGGWPSAPR
jgi:4-amino-4-deoxy-L-arabinose transferase-like glycosyltransferase